ncbi:pilus assembly protein [Chelativorans sp.]|uniref:TadE/TadG family type IV pilus assembly protein n=1 Tax=Chelativorans sp. TaxID=2203393 RepID=UPI002810A45B|nr:pilus assembly protein [Chelativorans sp.]
MGLQAESEMPRGEPEGLARRFCRERSGATAIEFAILALPFFLVLFAILETSLSLVAQQLMTSATEDVARQFRTGQLRAGDLTAESVRDRLCERMGLLFPSNCPGLRVDLQSFRTFAEAAAVFDGPVVPEQFRFDPGEAEEKNVLRVFYFWPVITDIMRESMSNLPDGNTLLFATQTWQNEPFTPPVSQNE